VARRGLLVDFGGVLTTNVFAAFGGFCTREGLAPDVVRHAFREDETSRGLLVGLETGTVTEEDFERGFGAALGLPAEKHEGLIGRLWADLGPDEEMVEAVAGFRAKGVRTGLISNSWGHGRYDRSTFDEMFDGVVISGEVGLNKPEPEIFHMGAERIGVPPEECVFVDDLRENCEGAEAVGMTAVLHRGSDGSVPELERLLGVELR
jgi:epoxide hydrolase-like predicted phosphatase